MGHGKGPVWDLQLVHVYTIYTYIESPLAIASEIPLVSPACCMLVGGRVGDRDSGVHICAPVPVPVRFGL